MERIKFNKRIIGLIVRGKVNEDHAPSIMHQHADCLLPNGEPVGFFGNNGAATGGASSVSWNSIYMNEVGVVIDYKKMRRIMPHFTDVNIAKKRKIKSTVLLIEVDIIEALKFHNFWKYADVNKKQFNLLGNNCSTFSSKAFIEAGIVKRGIPGLDTPNNLYKQLKNSNRKTVSYSGYFGHTPGSSPGMIDLLIDDSN